MFTSLRVKLVLILIAITVTAVAVSTGYTIRMQKQFALKQASERATEDLRLISSEIQTHLQWVAKDILVLRDLPQLHRLLEEKSQNAKDTALESVESAFLVLTEHHRIYHQIRFLDETGMERQFLPAQTPGRGGLRRCQDCSRRSQSELGDLPGRLGL